jgi:glyoxylase-like metal-dependent hydrolase (beta-lactamase superfamily II)
MRFRLLGVLALLGFCTQLAAAQQLHATAVPELRLYAIDCARMRTGNGVVGANPCFLIRHPKGDLLWETGLPQAIADLPGGTTRMGTAEVTVSRKLTDVLATLQMSPADVDYISLSHSHPDHIGNAALFTTSTWIVDRDERAWAFGPEARRSPLFAVYQALENMPTRLIEGDSDLDLFGDGSVLIIQTPGHTPGHAVLLVRLQEGGPVLLAGDIWNTPESRSERRGTPQQLATMDKVERILVETRARLVRHHVAADFDALPAFPAFLR